MRQALLNNYINHMADRLMSVMGNPGKYADSIRHHRLALERAMKAAGHV